MHVNINVSLACHLSSQDMTEVQHLLLSLKSALCDVKPSWIEAIPRLVTTLPGRLYLPPSCSLINTEDIQEPAWYFDMHVTITFFWCNAHPKLINNILVSSLCTCVALRPASWRIYCKFLFFFFLSWDRQQNWPKQFAFTTFLWLKRSQPATCQMWQPITHFARLAHKLPPLFFFSNEPQHKRFQAKEFQHSLQK